MLFLEFSNFPPENDLYYSRDSRISVAEIWPALLSHKKDGRRLKSANIKSALLYIVPGWIALEESSSQDVVIGRWLIFRWVLTQKPIRCDRTFALGRKNKKKISCNITQQIH